MDKLAGRVVVASIVLLVFTALFVAARLYTRLLIIRTIGPDDGMSARESFSHLSVWEQKADWLLAFTRLGSACLGMFN